MGSSKGKKIRQKSFPIRRPQPQKRLAWAISCLFILVIFILLGKTLSLIKEFKSSKASGKSYSWNGRSTINLVIKSDQVYAVSFDPGAMKLIILKIPGDTYLNLPDGYGSWPTRSIFALGEREQPPKGAGLLKNTLEQTLGVPIDGYVLLEKDAAALPLEKLITSLRQNPFNLISINRYSMTDLAPVEYLRLLWGIRGVRGENLKLVDLEKSPITDSFLLPDKTRALRLERTRLDTLIQKEFKDDKLTDESLSVAIYNSTKHPQLAEAAARIVINSGGRVIFTGNSEASYQKSVIFLKAGEQSYTRLRLAQIFAPGCLEDYTLSARLFNRLSCDRILSDNHDSEVLNSRAQVSIVLGEDFFARSR